MSDLECIHNLMSALRKNSNFDNRCINLVPNRDSSLFHLDYCALVCVLWCPLSNESLRFFHTFFPIIETHPVTQPTPSSSGFD